MIRWFTCILLLVWTQTAFALTVDVGMITQVNGSVTVAKYKAGKSPATAYLKVSLGDRLSLGKNGRVQIVYFESSRQEVWKGPGDVEIGNGEGKSPTLKPEAKKLPPLVARQLVKTPDAQHGKTGMVTVRSLSSDTIESLEKQYKEYRSTAQPGDTTPELFLMTGLLEMKEYEHAQKVLNGFKQELPKKPELSSLISHFEPLVKEGLQEQ